MARLVVPERPTLLDKDLLDILACPACRAEVRLEGDRIVCTSCGRRYPVRDGIPIMLVDEAETPSSPSTSGETSAGETKR